MNLENTHKGVRTFCILLFGLFAIAGIGMYFYFGKGLLGGFGMSAGILSSVSFLHFVMRRQKTDKVESKLTVLLLSFCVLGIALIFYNKFSAGPHYIYGVGGGVSLIAGISYIMELIANLKDNIR